MPVRKGPKSKKTTTVKKSAPKKPAIRRRPAQKSPLERPEGTPGAAPPFGETA